MKCEYCDNEVPAGSTRCPSCGAAVRYAEPILRQVEVTANQREISSSDSPKYSDCTNVHVNAKNRLVFILLGVFLGSFGIHNFYSGYIARGIFKLLITVLTFGLLFWVSWLWAVVEICTVRIDSRGVPFET